MPYGLQLSPHDGQIRNKEIRKGGFILKLYEINEQIQALSDAIEFDPETGEIVGDADTLFEEINHLQMERKSILSYLGKLVLNLRSEQSALKVEELRLRNRRERLSKKEERLMHVLDRECGGEKTDLGIATLSYRKTSRVDVTDSAKAVRWLKRHKFTGCFRVPEPEVAKTEVKKLLNSGTQVPGCALIEDTSCSLR
jgi:hypothetical protein